MAGSFGDHHPDYEVRVVNEREARAGAGVLLVLGLIAFQNTFTTGDFALTRLAIVGFGADFLLRVLIGPKAAPSLIIGRLLVAGQTPEPAGAPQKRFAWAIGLAIALFMGLWLMVLNQAGPVAILGCLACLVLLFLESACGICVGCLVYNRLWPGRAQLCPGGACDIGPRKRSPQASWAQIGGLAAMVAALVVVAPRLNELPAPSRPGHQAAEAADCEVPAFAKAMGHEEMWKLHNGCT